MEAELMAADLIYEGRFIIRIGSAAVLGIDPLGDEAPFEVDPIEGIQHLGIPLQDEGDACLLLGKTDAESPGSVVSSWLEVDFSGLEEVVGYEVSVQIFYNNCELVGEGGEYPLKLLV